MKKRPIRGGWASVAPFLVVGLAAFLAFVGTLDHGLVWDDNLLEQQIETEIQEGGLGQLFRAEFLALSNQSSLPYYRPLPLLSIWWDFRLSSVFPVSHHLTNVLLHVLCTVLVFLLLRVFLSASRGALFGAFVFALHPIHTESVAFVSGRTDLFATVFIVASVLAWIRVSRGISSSPKWEYLVGVLAFFLAGLSKESSVVVPVVILAWDAVERLEGRGSRETWWVRNRLWLGGWSVAVVFLAAVRWGFADLGASLEDTPERVPLSLGPTIWLTYFRMLVFPWPQSAYYMRDQLDLDGWTMLGAGIVLGLCVLSSGRRSGRIGLFSLLWIVGFLLPVSALVPVNAAVVAERFLYLPSIGFCLLIGHLVIRLDESRRWRPVVLPAMLLVTVFFSWGTLNRNKVWKDDITLYSSIIQTAPTASFPHYNLAVTYQAMAGYEEEAIREFKETIRLQPGATNAYYNLGTIYGNLGRWEEAIEAYRAAIIAEPRNADAYLNLGTTYGSLGRYEEAIQVFKQALEVFPGELKARHNLVLAYAKKGDKTAARAEYEVLRKLSPERAQQLSPLFADP